MEAHSESDAILDEGCARNVSAELQYDKNDGETYVCKSRMLEVTETELILDSVQEIGKTVELRRGQSIDAFFGLNEDRYTFKSEVMDLRTLYQLNSAKTLIGIVLRRPKRVRSGQRRTNFRVSVLGEKPIPLLVHAAMPDGSGTCPLDAHCFEGELVNLAMTGAGIRVETDDGRRLKVNQQLFVTFRLPGENEVFYFLTEVRHVQSIADDFARRVGLKIKSWPNKREARRIQQSLQKYVTQLQQQALKRAG